MIKLFTAQFYAVENDVNGWLKENEDKVEVTKITQSSCYKSNDVVYVTVMIEYLELDTDESDLQLPSDFRL